MYSILKGLDIHTILKSGSRLSVVDLIALKSKSHVCKIIYNVKRRDCSGMYTRKQKEPEEGEVKYFSKI